MSVSYIPERIKFLLWGKAAGRCQYRGCNKCLYRDTTTKAEFNQAYIAHIVADKPGGPRGDAIRSELLKKDIRNLMLLCDTHHRLIDKVDEAGHPESLLLKMKVDHEKRMERITAISENRETHMVIYKANIGKQSPQLSYPALSPWLLSNGYYPATNDAIDLSLHNSPQRDKDDLFWKIELANLETQFKEQLRPKLRKGNIPHLSIFAFAPMPLLIKLGTLINDIQHAEIHQPIRKSKSWNLAKTGTLTKYQITRPRKKHPTVALNISLSATIKNTRITKVLGKACSIYTITIPQPFNDFLRNKRQLADFSLEIRLLFDQIKARYSGDTPLNMFPAMPIATAIELGRVWMPKADMPLIIYDENKAKNGFFKALEINNKL